MEIWAFAFLILGVLIVFYIFNILKNALILFLVTTGVLFLASKYYPQYFSFNTTSILIANLIIVGGYLILEILNIFFNIFDVIAAIISFLLSPFKKKKKDNS
ncbi:MAG: hypothetical protein GXN99_02300 [Candidatus Nanohaloarchaeota archaeon]|nr:hypothetical protein [Candidatus Nanohaloarchaeota archaeon]